MIFRSSSRSSNSSGGDSNSNSNSYNGTSGVAWAFPGVALAFTSQGAKTLRDGSSENHNVAAMQ